MNKSTSNYVALLEAKNLFFVFSLILVVDFGLWFQRTMYQAAGHDSWISVLLACPITFFVAWIIYRTVQHYPYSDLYRINQNIFGKWVAMVLNTMFAGYLLLLCCSMLRNIQEVVVTLLFPDLPGWLFMTTMCLLLIYGVFGGIRVIVGFMVVYFIIGQLIFGLQIFPIQLSQWDQLLPIMEASPKQLLEGAILMLKYNLGILQLYFFFPFVQDKKRANLYTQLSIIYAVLFCLFTLIIAIVFYGGDQLGRTTWPNLTAFKIVKLPVMERFDLLIVVYLVISVFSACLVLMWSSTRGFREAWKLKQKYALYLGCIVLIILSEVIDYRSDAENFSKGVRSIGIWIEYVYPLFLYICVRSKRYFEILPRGAKS